MKKVLASCLTCCALIGSMCFSSPLAQVQATETGTEQSSRTYIPIDLSVKEDTVGYTHVISTSLKNGEKIKIKGMTDKFQVGKNLNVSEDDTSSDKFTIDSPNDAKEFALPLINNKDNRTYTIKGTIENPPAEAARAQPQPQETRARVQLFGDNETEDPDGRDQEGTAETIKEVEIDLSKTSGSYDATVTGGDTKTTEVTVTPISGLSVNKTEKELPVGSSFELNLPEKLVDKYPDFSFNSRHYTIRDLEINGEPVDDNQYPDYIKFSDPQDHWKATLLPEIKVNDVVTFNAYSSQEDVPQAYSDRNYSLSNYGAEAEPKEKYPQIINPNQESIVFPVELTIVDEGKGDPIDDGEDDVMNVSLNITPEYKKLTSKGETYKVDASVEIDEDEDQQSKDYFAELKENGYFEVSFVSRDTNVATVAEDGTVTAVANGSTEIIAYVEGHEDELFGISKVDVEIPAEVAEDKTSNSAYPKTGDNFMAVSAAILTLGLSALVVAFMSKKQKNVNEEK